MHAAVEALEGKKAAIFGSALQVRTNKIPLHNAFGREGSLEMIGAGLPRSERARGTCSLAF